MPAARRQYPGAEEMLDGLAISGRIDGKIGGPGAPGSAEGNPGNPGLKGTAL